MRAGSAYQPTASATSRASSSSASRQTSGRSRLAWSAASTSGSSGLGDAGVRREGVDERAEALAARERLDEAAEGRLSLVHAAGGIGVPRGDRTRVRGAARQVARILTELLRGADSRLNDPQGHSRVPS